MQPTMGHLEVADAQSLQVFLVNAIQTWEAAHPDARRLSDTQRQMYASATWPKEQN
jgi:hypothetical protein